MILTVLAIKDRAVATFMQPFFSHHIGAAKRTFSDEINRQAPDNPLAKHPEDYDLFELGTFDDQTGRFECLPQPRQVSIGKDEVRGDRAG